MRLPCTRRQERNPRCAGKEKCTVIAMRRLMFRGWGVEAGLRIRVIHPDAPGEARKPVMSLAERALHNATIRREIDRQRAEAEVRWFTIGGV